MGARRAYACVRLFYQGVWVFPQIENVDVGVNVDIVSHPVGYHTPQIYTTVCLLFQRKFHTDCKFQGKMLRQNEYK